MGGENRVTKKDGGLINKIKKLRKDTWRAISAPLKIPLNSIRRTITVLKTSLKNGCSVMYVPRDQRPAVLAGSSALLFGQIWALGNPLAMLSQSTSTSKGTQPSPRSFGQAVYLFLPLITWTALFFLNFVLTATLAWSLGQAPVYSMVLPISLAHYVSVLAVEVSGISVPCGSVNIPGFLFASGGAVAFALLVASIFIGLYLFMEYFFPNSEERGRV